MTPANTPTLDRVYTVADYYDGPREGIADFRGSPHAYSSLRQDIGSRMPDTFLLKPLDSEALALALEDWAIWERWEAAYKSGRTHEDTHPALPVDRPRHIELEALLEPLLRVDPSAAIWARAEFRSNIAEKGSLHVVWTVIDPENPSVA